MTTGKSKIKSLSWTSQQFILRRLYYIQKILRKRNKSSTNFYLFNFCFIIYFVVIVVLLIKKLRETINVFWIGVNSKQPEVVTSTPTLRAVPGEFCLFKQSIYQSSVIIWAWSQRFFTSMLASAHIWM